MASTTDDLDDERPGETAAILFQNIDRRDDQIGHDPGLVTFSDEPWVLIEGLRPVEW